MNYLAIVLCLVMAIGLNGKSIIIANYHNVIMFFPRELGGNDDVRVIFDVRNVTDGTFKYLPVVVAVEYDAVQNNAYLYLESAVTSYIVLLKWAGGRWCYQVLFEFKASQFSKYMYHSIILWDNYIYWTTDRFIMSGRLPGYEKRLLLQPSWNQLYSMTLDKHKEIIYAAAFDYTENALFSCNLRLFTCSKLVKTEFTLNYVYFNVGNLYLASIEKKMLFQLDEVQGFAFLKQTIDVKDSIANMLVVNEGLAVYTDQQTIKVITNFNSSSPSIRQANAHLIDPYALQYVFSFNKVFDFDGYPYPYQFSDYKNLLYKNNLYIFYFYVCGMSLIENDLSFLPQMDLNNQFLYLEDCQVSYFRDQTMILIPLVISGGSVFILVVAAALIFCWRTKMCHLCKEKKTVKSSSTFGSTIAGTSIEEPPPPLNDRYAHWTGNVENNRRNSQQIHRAVTNLNNLDVLEDSRNYRVKTGVSTDDLTSLSSMSSSSDSVSVSSITTGRYEQALNKSDHNTKVTMNDNYIQFIQSLKANKKQERDATTDSGDSLLKESMVHPKAFKVFTESSVDLEKPQILSAQNLPQSELISKASNFNDGRKISIGSALTYPSVHTPGLSPVSFESETVAIKTFPKRISSQLSNTKRLKKLPCYDEATSKLKNNQLNASNIESIYDKVDFHNSLNGTKQHSSVDQLAKKIQQLPNMTNSKPNSQVGSIASRRSSAFIRPVHSSSFVSEANHRSSYLNILKAMDMSSDSTGTFNDVRI